jgi:4-amino-4-deoxy-L-arabinose transferase-like glycosyltransferase
VIWFASILLLFQLAYVRRHQYIMPAYPAMAFLAAWGILQWRHRERVLAGTTLFVVAAMATALFTPLWTRAMDNNFYGTKLTAVRYLAAHPALAGTLLVLDQDENYCFTCDTAGYYTGLVPADYTRERLAEAVTAGGPVYVLVENALLARLTDELPPADRLRTIHEDPQVSLVSVAAGELPVR